MAAAFPSSGPGSAAYRHHHVGGGGRAPCDYLQETAVSSALFLSRLPGARVRAFCLFAQSYSHFCLSTPSTMPPTFHVYSPGQPAGTRSSGHRKSWSERTHTHPSTHIRTMHTIYHCTHYKHTSTHHVTTHTHAHHTQYTDHKHTYTRTHSPWAWLVQSFYQKSLKLNFSTPVCF